MKKGNELTLRDIFYTPKQKRPLSVRAINCMYAKCFNRDITLAEFAEKYSKYDMLSSRCCGKITLQEIDDLFKKHGIAWK